MRRIELAVPVERAAAVRDVFDEAGVAYTASEPREGRNGTELVVVRAPVPVEDVERVLDALDEAVGIDHEDGYLVVDRPEAVHGDRPIRREAAAERRPTAGTIPRAELVARATDLVPRSESYFTLLVLSVIIAVAGLVTNSAAVVVGSMVVAPLMGPALSTGVGTVIDDAALFRRGVWLQVAGVAVSVVVATAAAVVIEWIHLFPAEDLLAIPEITSRVAPDLLALVVAIAAGLAGAYSLSTGSSTTLVGVAVAAALVPPLGVVGIGIAWGMPVVAVGAFVLVVVNVLVINLAGIGVFWLQGYRPRGWDRDAALRRTAIRRATVLAVAILLASSFLGLVTLAELEVADTKGDATAAIEDTLDDPAYDELDLIDVRFDTDDSLPVSQPERVVVEVGHPPGETPSELAAALDAAVDDLAVDVSFDVQA